MLQGVIGLAEFKARFDNSFKVQSSRWESYAGLWLTDAMADIGNPLTLPIADVPLTVTNYKATLPQGVALLLGVIKDTHQLDRVDTIDPVTHGVKFNTQAYYEFVDVQLVNGFPTYTYTTIPANIKSEEFYALDHIGGLDFTFDTGLIRAIFHSIGGNLNAVVIPDIHSYIEACKYFILRKLLQYGYKHPIYSLDVNNPFTNVNILYEGQDGRGGWKRRARLDSTKLDSKIRFELANMTKFSALLGTHAMEPYNHIK